MTAQCNIEALGLGDYIRAKAGEGSSGRDIAQALAKEHNVRLPPAAITRWLRGQAEDGAATADEKNAAVKPARELEIIDEQIRQMDDWRRSEEIEIGERLKIIREQRAAIVEKLKFGKTEEADDNAEGAVDLFNPEERRKLLREVLDDQQD